MKHLLLKLMSVLLLTTTVAYAQNRTVTGTVTSADDNQPMPSVTVLVKGTTTATQTDVDGKYSISAANGSTLVFSFVGYASKEVKLGAQTSINIALASDAKQLGEVVVTALGIEKKAKGLTYSTQKVSGDELTNVKDANVMNSLSGKAAGVQVSRGASGAGGSVKVALRGARSVNAGNDPLYVIDGVPMANYQPNQALTTFGDNNTGNRDGGDGIGNINPDDIESMQVLKGASAAALYGSQAANGVILITTKKGKAGVQKVDFSTSYSNESAVSLPELQSAYGRKGTALSSWGAATSASSVKPEDFFKSGSTLINSLSVQGGTEKAQNYFSYANTHSGGIIPTNSLDKHNFNFRETARLFENKLTLDANVNLVNQKVKNRPTTGFYNNPFMAVYQFPRGLDFNQYADAFEKYDGTRKLNSQNWFVYEDNDSFSQNPYWILNRMPSSEKLNRTMASLSARWDISNMFNLMVRGNVDRTSNLFEQKMYAGTATVIAGGVADPTSADRLTSGRYIYNNNTNTQMYADVLLNFKSSLAKNVGLTASVGSSITDTKVDLQNFDSFLAGIYKPNVFTLTNLISGSNITQQNTHRQLQAVYGTTQLAFKDAIFLDLTARNDWSSTLANTDAAKKGYFYPSVGTTFVLNELITMPAAVNLGKLRMSYAQVGNDFPVNVTNFQPTLIQQGGVYAPVVAVPDPDVNLKPEISSSMEIGTEWRFFNDRFTVDVTAFKTNTTNQLLQRVAPAGNPFGAANYWINGGNIENKGIETVLGVTPVKTDDFSYTATVNMSVNRNKITELPAESGTIDLTTSGNNSYISRLTVGNPYGDIWGKDFKRDAEGNIQYDSKTLLPLTSNDFVRLGNPTPKMSVGLNNSFKYKNVTLNFLIDGRFGGEVMSLSQAQLDLFGVSQATADARKAGFVMLEGHKIDKVNEMNEDGTVKASYTGAAAVEKYYGLVGGRAGITSQYMYDATNIRLREMSLGYTLPSSVIGNKVVKSVTLSVTGRNLFYIAKKAPFDPEATMSTGNGLQGVDVFGLPATRSFGVSAKVSF